MIECRHCREVFRSPPEKLGARCPNCRLPLFERTDRGRGAALEAGVFCAVHDQVEAVGRCRRCAQRVCAVCRSRWYEELVCLACAERALLAGESSPRDIAKRDQLPVWSLGLALVGWTLLLLTLVPWIQLQAGGSGARAAQILFFLSLLPAAVALGQAAMAVRIRVQRLGLAAWSMGLSGLQIGLMLGVLLINIWHN